MLPKIKKLLFQVQFQQNDSPYQRKNGDSYSLRFQQLRQALITNLQSFIPVDVIPRQPPASYAAVTSRYDRSTYIDTKKNKIVQYPRPNSFQIYVDNFLLFSHLQSGAWPDVNAICDWALRVAEKIIDLEIKEEEEGMPQGLKNVKQLQEQQQEMGNYQEMEQKANNAEEFRGFPPVGNVFRSSANRTKLSNKLNNQIQRQTRYSSLRDKNFDKAIHFNKTQRNSFSTTRKNKMNSFDQNSYNYQNTTRSKDFGFHWHLQSKNQTISMQDRQNINYHTIDVASARARMAEYTPVPAVNQRVLNEKIEEYRRQSKMKLNKIELKLSQSILNCFRIHYKFDGNKIKKISHDCQWSPLLCESPLPLNGQYYLNMIVHNSNENKIIMGLAPISYYPSIENRQVFDNLLCFNIGTGEIKDCTSLEQRETTWRDYGKKYTQSKPFSYKLVVNMNSKIVQWHANNQKISSTILPNSFKFGFRAFISLHNIYDLVYVNSQLKSSPQTTPNKSESNKKQSLDASSKAQQKQYQIRKNVESVKAQQQTLKIDDAFNSTPTFQGRIKRQRLQRYIDKNSAKKIQINVQSTIKRLQQHGQTIKYEDNLKAFNLRKKQLEDKQHQVKIQSPGREKQANQGVINPIIQDAKKQTPKRKYVIIDETKMNRKGANGAEKDISVVIVKQNNAETISQTHKIVQQIKEPPKEQKVDVILLQRSPSEVQKQLLLKKSEENEQFEPQKISQKGQIIQQKVIDSINRNKLEQAQTINHQVQEKVDLQVSNQTQILKQDEKNIQADPNKDQFAFQSQTNHDQTNQQLTHIEKPRENQQNKQQPKAINTQQKQMKKQQAFQSNQEVKKPIQLSLVTEGKQIVPKNQQEITHLKNQNQQIVKKHDVHQINTVILKADTLKQAVETEIPPIQVKTTILEDKNPQQLPSQGTLIHQQHKQPAQVHQSSPNPTQIHPQTNQQSFNPINDLPPPHQTPEIVNE